MARKGGSKGLKRYAAPSRMQVVSVKEKKFIVKPEPGPHGFGFSLPLQVLVRDVLKIAKTGREAKYLANHSMILIDGVERFSHKYPVGLMDVVSVKELNKHYRMLVDEKGRLIPVEVPPEEASLKICRINKKYLYRGRLRFTTEDGRTFEMEDPSLNVGGSVLVRVPDNAVIDKAPLTEGYVGYIFNGKHAGSIGIVKSISNSSLLKDGLVFLSLKEGRDVSTIRNHVMIVGRERPWLRLF
ncbi:MAG: hypothetical protein ACUVQY_01020 [Thermoproteota archaeon]